MSTIRLAISGSCRQRCAFCDADLSGQPLPPAHLRRRIDEAFARGATRIRFTGDDPLLHPHLLRALNHATGLGLKVELHGHGGGLDDPRRIERLARLGLDRLHLSLHGDRTTHDALTGTPGSHDRVRRVIGLCGDIPLTLHSTLTATNLRPLEALASALPPEVDRWVLHLLRPARSLPASLHPELPALLQTVGRILVTAPCPVRVDGPLPHPFGAQASHALPQDADLALLHHDLPPTRPVRLQEEHLHALAARRGVPMERLDLRLSALGLPVHTPLALPPIGHARVCLSRPTDPTLRAPAQALANALGRAGVRLRRVKAPGIVVTWSDGQELHRAVWDLWPATTLPLPQRGDHLWLSHPGRVSEALALGWSPARLRLLPPGPLAPIGPMPRRGRHWLTVGSPPHLDAAHRPAPDAPSWSVPTPAGLFLAADAPLHAAFRWAAWAAGRNIPWVAEDPALRGLCRALGGVLHLPGRPLPMALGPTVGWDGIAASLLRPTSGHGATAFHPQRGATGS